MAVSNWEQKKKHALELLHKLLDIWQGREPLNKIEAIGPQVNEAVLMLDLPDTGLPLPYDDKKMSSMGVFADVLAAKDRSGGPGDEFSNNINAWIQLIEKAKGSVLTMPVRSSKDNWEAIKSEYGISKRDFGKKINFVSDSFKREIIFRDVEHAFVLASEGFAKPAVILAGGVIEELLRLYLEHKKIQPKGKRFVDYIKACEDNDLLKRGVSRLTDSIRDFRNLVHLDNEKTKRHTVSKATAKGAVASIFTIANDFQKVSPS